MESHLSIARKIVEINSLSLSNESILMLSDIIVSKELGKGELFVDEGQVCKYIGFVEKGMVRQFYYKNGKDLTEHFSSEGRIFICIESFLKQEPTRLMAEAVEPSIVWGLLYQKILEHSLIESQIKADMFRFETAHIRYDRLMKHFPEVVRRAPLIHIASFLQMTPETLSRVRAGLL